MPSELVLSLDTGGDEIRQRFKKEKSEAVVALLQTQPRWKINPGVVKERRRG